MGDVPMPAFLDPRKVQEEAQSRQSDAPRSGNRVDVTRASINEAGRVDAANAPAVPMPAPASESADETVPELQAKPLDIPDVSVAPVAPVTLPEVSATAPAAPVAAAVKQRRRRCCAGSQDRGAQPAELASLHRVFRYQGLP